MAEVMDDQYQPEYHIAFLSLLAADADDDLSEVEVQAMVAAIDGLFRGLGRDGDAQEYLAKVAQDIDTMDDEAVENILADAVEELFDRLPDSQLIAVWEVLRGIARKDGLADGEDEFLSQLHEIWFEE